MNKTVLVSELGGPAVMKFVDLDPGRPGPGEVLLRHKAIGVNFADIHYRRGTAPRHAMAKLPIPFTPGLEGAGIVEAIGDGVTGIQIGDRVGYATASLTIGAYSEARLFPAARVFKLPDGVGDSDVAALLYRAITVHGMIRQCYPIKAADVILLHAAAGGIGSVLSQWAHALGATVIGTVSDNSKVERALSNGCTHVVVNADEDFVVRTRDITGGRGADVCFDGVGKALFHRSFEALKRYGTMVSFGQASGMPDPVDIVDLQHEGLYLTKFSGGTYNDIVGEYHHRAREVLQAIESGVFRLGDHASYAFDDVVKAHEDMESRRTVGSLVLIP